MIKLLLFSILFILIITTPVALYLLNSPKQISTKQQSTPSLKPEATLFLFPHLVTAIPGQSTTLRVMITTKGIPPTLVQLELAYDPTTLSNIQLTPGDFFANPVVQLQKIDQSTGRISYALSATPNDTLTQQSGTIALLSFIPTRATQTEISFLPKTMTRSFDKVNTLVNTKGATIVGSIHNQ